ncbi:hypothetical protein Lfu02_34670 [Longispora fulva]|uniref:Pyrrolidone-carboxylate peptidase n=1 Tax=Longispora fulva TaxID=619741 RepID=A0A8J7GYM7_9ACTN|nr:hypothetical protein [Longispora fulva]MBG6141749.1 pyrrolidone-carboxylate peptidase [Longispora fulva]GIG59095.1 hypothetical protein Lfu02_34670 [Longispora fulva]
MRILLGAVTAVALLAAPVPATAAAPSCLDTSVAPTTEQSRLGPQPAEIIRRAGLTSFGDRFPAALCGTRSPAELTALVTDWGTALWSAAVNRSQGRRPTTDPAPLAALDDRPLYWTRLTMARQLRQFHATAGTVSAFEDASRGLVDNAFSSTGIPKIFVSGFDPFGLDHDPRTANPSGAAALALNGRRITLRGGGQAEVRAVVLPVRYADFDADIVERAFGPRIAQAALISSVSQGYPGEFTLEGFNGRARSADPFPDNEGALSGGTYSSPVVAPGMGPGAEFIPGTLPTAAMVTAAGPYPVRVNNVVVEIPAGGTSPVYRENGPTQGSRAVQGGGGGYLSNEVAYRSNRLRVALGSAIPGGHLHTPVLTGLPDDDTLVTGPEFERTEAAIVGQVVEVFRTIS